eukprot:1195037-Prorocentrum_minimum.AAC.5
MKYSFGETWMRGEFQAGAVQSGCIIFLHGLGDTGQGWASNLDKLPLKNMRLVCPTAPKQPVTLMLGPETFTKSYNTAWFDWTPSMGPEDFTKIEWKGVNASVSHVQQLIESEIASGVSSENIFVGGFSQGGTVALRAALKYERKLGGVIMLSSFVGPVDDLQPGKIPTVNSQVRANSLSVRITQGPKATHLT